MRTSTVAREHLLPAQLAVRAALAAGVTVSIATALALPNPVFALTAAIIVIDLDPRWTRTLAWKRFAGTFAGALLGASGAMLLPTGPIAIIATVLVTMLLCHALHLDGSARISGYLAAVIVMQYGDSPWRYAADRFLETTLGIVVALALSFLPRLYKGKDEVVE